MECLGWKGPKAQLIPPLARAGPPPTAPGCSGSLSSSVLLPVLHSFIITLYLHLPPHFYGGNPLKSFWKCRQLEPPHLPLPVTPQPPARLCSVPQEPPQCHCPPLYLPQFGAALLITVSKKIKARISVITVIIIIFTIVVRGTLV